MLKLILVYFSLSVSAHSARQQLNSPVVPPAEKCGDRDRYTSKASWKNLSLQSENSGKPGTSLLRCIAFCV